MGLMDRLFGKRDNQQEQQAPVVRNKNNNMTFQTLQRRDGTSINIMPVVDSMGNQTYEIVNGLKISKQQQWQEYQAGQAARDKQAKEQAIIDSQKYGVNIKTSHAEDLTIE